MKKIGKRNKSFSVFSSVLLSVAALHVGMECDGNFSHIFYLDCKFLRLLYRQRILRLSYFTNTGFLTKNQTLAVLVRHLSVLTLTTKLAIFLY